MLFGALIMTMGAGTFAQESSGTITGLVKDQSRIIVTAATIQSETPNRYSTAHGLRHLNPSRNHAIPGNPGPGLRIATWLILPAI